MPYDPLTILVLSNQLFAANNQIVLVSDCCSIVMVYGQGYCHQKSVLTYYSIDPDSRCSLGLSQQPTVMSIDPQVGGLWSSLKSMSKVRQHEVTTLCA